MPDFRQLNLTYQPRQDRLLLRIALEDREMLFWLTRSITGLLMQHLHAWSVGGSPAIAQVPPWHQQAALEIERQAALQKAEFSAPYQVPAQPGRPLLVGAVELVEQEGKSRALRLTAFNGFNVAMNLKPEVVHAFAKMLDEVAQSAQWNLPSLGGEPPAALEAPAVAH